jgi:hypothetical protein
LIRKCYIYLAPNETSYPNGTILKNSPDRFIPSNEFSSRIYLIHHIGPVKYAPEDPTKLLYEDIFRIPNNWDYGTPSNITIGGKKGTTWDDIKWSKNYNILAEKHRYLFSLDKDVVVAITTSGKWDEPKDLSLFEETLDIMKR